MRITIGISEARARLLELANRVASRSGDVVVIENRRRGERVALVAESYLRSLEIRVKEMQKTSKEGFKLEGSVESDLTADELADAIDELRREQHAADLRRMAEFAELFGDDRLEPNGS
jgi:hypothetical protein